ncbi:MAG: DNA-binding protein [Tistrella sp.]|uniref:Transcriptional regulator n=1 Tax=Tistrella mobilis TaxID=171437 RepID=A0A3B9INU6_9PROT|nr:helix-turn-helix transcriptional regulator [Tistrella sp.]MAD39542.1 DNA-binding protein [Tistrella sp.]MBA74887.1 DNA-binding protein [Tistrella sp.]HAE49475.1 transcriptional regulator [Tistrella mobilis]
MAAKSWSKEEIKCAIHKKGMTLSGLGELHGVHPSNMRAVWSRPVRAAERAIAEFLDVSPKELWPDRYPIRKASILSNENAQLIASRKSARAG